MSKIEPIENPGRRKEMREIARRLFLRHDSCEALFKPEIEACLIFHTNDESDNDYLTKEQYEAIIAAAKHMGDNGFVVSTLCGIVSDDDANDRFYVTPLSRQPKEQIEVDGQ